MDWFRAVQAKKPAAIQAPSSTVYFVEDTDGKSYPDYVNFSYDSMAEIETKLGKGLIFNNYWVVLPLNQTDVLELRVEPMSDLAKEIISTIGK
jgi:hypothetical protein